MPKYLSAQQHVGNYCGYGKQKADSELTERLQLFTLLQQVQTALTTHSLNLDAILLLQSIYNSFWYKKGNYIDWMGQSLFISFYVMLLKLSRIECKCRDFYDCMSLLLYTGKSEAIKHYAMRQKWEMKIMTWPLWHVECIYMDLSKFVLLFKYYPVFVLYFIYVLGPTFRNLEIKSRCKLNSSDV